MEFLRSLLVVGLLLFAFLYPAYLISKKLDEMHMDDKK